METKHTQGEWITKDGQIYPQETGKTLAMIPYFDKDNKEQQANAEIICRAVNSHDILVEAVKMAKDYFEDTFNKGGGNGYLDIELIEKAIRAAHKDEL